MICISPIMNLRNSNLSTKKTNNNYRQNNLNAFKADSVSFGNAIPKPQELAGVFETLVAQVRKDPKAVDPEMLGRFVTDMVAYAKQSIQAAESGAERFYNLSKPEVEFPSTGILRALKPVPQKEARELSYVLKSSLAGDKYRSGVYLWVKALVDDSNFEQVQVYNPTAPHTIFAKIMDTGDWTKKKSQPWGKTNAGILIPPEQNLVKFTLFDKSSHDIALR